MSKKSENRQFVSASGIANDVVQKLAQAVYKRGGDDDDLRRIISDQTLREELAGRIVFRDGKNLAEMIAACRFRYADPNITEANFPLTGPIAPVSDMLTFSQKDLGGKDMTTAEVEAAVPRKGCRSATLAEQLAYAKAKWNGKDWVVALGSSWVLPGGDRLVPYLYEDDDGRKLSLRWDRPEGRWHDAYLFLVVRK